LFDEILAPRLDDGEALINIIHNLKFEKKKKKKK
jgi:hypothetical protein